MNWGHLFFKFDGRVNRAKFWIAALIFAAINVAIRVLADNRLVVFFPPSSRIDPLVTFVAAFAFIVVYPLAVAGTVWLAHFAYLRIQRAH